MYVFPGRGICRDFFRWTGGISLTGPSPVCNGRQKLPRVCVCQGAPPVYCRKASLQPRTPARLQHVIASHVLATANTYPSSACHCVLAPHTPAKFPHVLAPNVPATAHTPLPSACHCEPVRTLVRQSASPQGNLATWQYFGRIRTHAPRLSLRTSAHTGVAIRNPAEKLCKLAILRANSYALSRIRPRHCSLLCPAAGMRIATSLRSSQ